MTKIESLLAQSLSRRDFLQFSAVTAELLSRGIDITNALNIAECLFNKSYDVVWPGQHAQLLINSQPQNIEVRYGESNGIGDFLKIRQEKQHPIFKELDPVNPPNRRMSGELLGNEIVPLQMAQVLKDKRKQNVFMYPHAEGLLLQPAESNQGREAVFGENPTVWGIPVIVRPFDYLQVEHQKIPTEEVPNLFKAFWRGNIDHNFPYTEPTDTFGAGWLIGSLSMRNHPHNDQSSYVFQTRGFVRDARALEVVK